jgi:hypothetical protein
MPRTTGSEDNLSFLNFFKAFADPVDLCDKVHQLWRVAERCASSQDDPCTIRMYEIIALLTFPNEKGEEILRPKNTQRAILRLDVLTTNVQKRSSQAPAQAPLPLFFRP